MADKTDTREEARRNTRGRFEQWAKNPTCDANALSAVHNVRMDKVAESSGIEATFGQSPFAIARGNAFEAGLFVDDAARLRSALERKGALPPGSSGFLDLRLKINGGPSLKSVDDALGATASWLANLATGAESADASVVAAPMIKIPRGVILPEALLIIDAVTVARGDEGVSLTVGEIKVFPDRGGHTDPSQIAGARAQAGLYQRALEMAVSAAGLSHAIQVQADGFLVFTWPGSNQPSVRAGEDLTFQAIRAERGFERLEEVAAGLVREDDFAADLPELIDRVLEAETTYGESCLSFCDLAPRCHKRATDADSGLLLGAEASRLLGDIPMARAIELMNGGDPLDDRETDLQRQLGAQ